MMLSGSGLPDIPPGGSDDSLLKSRMRRFLQLVDYKHKDPIFFFRPPKKRTHHPLFFVQESRAKLSVVVSLELKCVASCACGMMRRVCLVPSSCLSLASSVFTFFDLCKRRKAKKKRGSNKLNDPGPIF